MGSLKTILFLFLFLPISAKASERSLLTAFASCTGRYSAEVEHGWLIPNDRSDEVASRHRQFVDLLNATVRPRERIQALNLRIDAKAAHAALLKEATFSGDETRARRATQRARSEIAYCRSLLLEG